MKLVLIIGAGAVGKMTVGQELAKRTELKLFHNHMTIEPVIEVFGYYHKQAVVRLRDVFFEEFAKTDEEGLIFTYIWAFDRQHDWDYIRHVTEIFRNVGSEIYCVELVAPQAVRLERNATENRLKNKASKRDIALSERRLLDGDTYCRCVSYEGEVPFENYLRLDNSAITAAEAAERIKAHFNL